MPSSLRWLAFAPVLLACFASAQVPFFLHDGDRVVWYGDSITDAGHYGHFAETYVVTRFPGMKVRFINSGWGADRVSGGLGGPVDKRLERDVLAHRPTVVTIMLGMNDAGVRPLDEELFSIYKQGIEHILDRIRFGAPGARVWMIQPSPYDDVTREPAFPGGYNGVLRTYGDYLRDLATRGGLGLADFNTPVVDTLAAVNAINPDIARRMLPDRIHPDVATHLVMATALLKSWGAPSLVSSIRIDAAARSATAEGAKVSVDRKAAGLSWTQTDAGLPFPIDRKNERMALVVKVSGLDRELNRQTIAVTNLPADRYSLRIDGQAIGDFTKQELEQGVDLSTLDTPMMRQAAEVHTLTLRRAAVRYAMWRTLVVGLEDQKSRQRDDAIKSMQRLEDQLIAKQHEKARPIAHRFELVASP
jgi:lysophospholipase L1-like esterase